MSNSSFPSSRKGFLSLVKGVLSTGLKSLLWSLHVAATCLNTSPPMIVTSAAVSTTPITGTPPTTTFTFRGLLPRSCTRTCFTSPFSSESDSRYCMGSSSISGGRPAPALLTILAFALGVEFPVLSFFGLGQL